MPSYKVIHPKRLENVIKGFLNAAATLTFTAEYYTDSEEYSKELHELLKNRPNNFAEIWFNLRSKYCESVEEKALCRVHRIKEKNCCAYVGRFFDDAEECFTIGYNYDFLLENSDPFYVNFIHRCPKAKNYISAVPSLLHELGHFETNYSIPNEFNRYNTVTNNEHICDSFYIKTNNREAAERLSDCLYFSMPDERLATDWAIDFINNSDNDNLIRDFEMKFLSCFDFNF